VSNIGIDTNSSQKLKVITRIRNNIMKLMNDSQDIKRLIYYTSNDPLESMGVDLEGNFVEQPDLDIDLLKIVGVMNVRNNRQGPFEIYIDQKKQLNMFEYKMQSCLGRVNIFGSHANKQKLMEFINNSELEIMVEEKNSFIWLQLKMDIDEPIESMYNDLIELINFTDHIEESISKIDESFE